MPPYALTSMKFMRQVLKGSKKLLDLNEVCRMKIKNFAEFTAASALEQTKNDVSTKAFIPDEWYAGKRCSREYLWSVVSTIHNDFT